MQRPKLSGDRVNSRWWYWIAAVPTVFAFWLVTVAWVAFAISVDPGLVGESGPPFVVRLFLALPQATLVSLVAVGIPFVVLTALFPFAVFQDTQAINRAELDWEPSGNYALVALVGLVALAGLALTDLSLAVIVGFVLSVPFSLYYLRKRHEHVGVP
ncbi:hypothetical protein [Haladaptatus salinisoli]|uniref:hypothetical protein n=1 Tax=Haladaptatus salinisoli TaxID=2884876 RepID=UPI001D0A94ED|nr:hypothetical protein [Haladaptatus salinisoli]